MQSFTTVIAFAAAASASALLRRADAGNGILSNIHIGSPHENLPYYSVGFQGKTGQTTCVARGEYFTESPQCPGTAEYQNVPTTDCESRDFAFDFIYLNTLDLARHDKYLLRVTDKTANDAGGPLYYCFFLENNQECTPNTPTTNSTSQLIAPSSVVVPATHDGSCQQLN